MSNFREIVRAHVEDQALREYFKESYGSLSEEKRYHHLNFLRSKGYIDHQVDSIIDSFITEIDKTKKKKRRKLNIGFAAVNVVVTPLVSYAVNEEQWVYVWGISALFLVIAIFYVVLNDE